MIQKQTKRNIIKIKLNKDIVCVQKDSLFSLYAQHFIKNLRKMT